jgi:hypothetical protein
MTAAANAFVRFLNSSLNLPWFISISQFPLSVLVLSFLLSLFQLSAFSITTLRAGQFAGRLLPGPQSTDSVFVLPAHTAQKSGKQKPFPVFKSRNCESRKQKPVSAFVISVFSFLSALHPKAFQFPLSKFPLSAFPAAPRPKAFVRSLNSSVNRP